MCEKKKVAVLFGGCSTEYEVSLQSGYAVATQLDASQYEVILIGITREGNWRRYYGVPEHIADGSWTSDQVCVPAILSPSRDMQGILEFQKDQVVFTPIDIVFPVLHGKNGEDGTVQGLLEMAGIPFVGCNTLSSAICMDKDIAHRLVEKEGILTPASVMLTRPVSSATLQKKRGGLKFPLFVKPVSAGSSVGVAKVHQNDELEQAVETAFSVDRRVLLEEAVDGVEVGCAVLGNQTLAMGALDEIELSHGFFDYTEKYTLKTAKVHTPARIDRETEARIKQTAAHIYKILQCSGLARVDLFLTRNKQIYFGEVNTIPGFTVHSRYPNMLKQIGLEFPDLLDLLIRLGLKR